MQRTPLIAIDIGLLCSFQAVSGGHDLGVRSVQLICSSK